MERSVAVLFHGVCRTLAVSDGRTRVVALFFYKSFVTMRALPVSGTGSMAMGVFKKYSV